jgi:hypothetical protein
MASVAVGTLSASVPEPKSLAGLVITRPLITVLSAKFGKVPWLEDGSIITPARVACKPTESDRHKLRRSADECFGRREGNFRLIAKQKLATGPITSEWFRDARMIAPVLTVYRNDKACCRKLWALRKRQIMAE